MCIIHGRSVQQRSFLLIVVFKADMWCSWQVSSAALRQQQRSSGTAFNSSAKAAAAIRLMTFLAQGGVAQAAHIH